MKTSVLTPILLSISCFFVHFLNGQGLTNGEIFDYQTNDEFVISTWTKGPPTYAHSKVISRMDFGNDSVNYVFETIIYSLNTSTFIWESVKGTHLKTYTNLDVPYFELFKQMDSIGYDTFFNPDRKNYEFKDSIYTDSCAFWNYRNIFKQAPLGETDIKTFRVGKKIGVLKYFWQRDGNTPNIFQEELLYYKNANGGCGNLEELPTSIEKIIRNKQINIWPNPVTDKINLEINGVYSYQIIDGMGREILSSNYTHDNIIDIGILPSGIYMISIKLDEGIFNTKFVKE